MKISIPARRNEIIVDLPKDLNGGLLRSLFMRLQTMVIFGRKELILRFYETTSIDELASGPLVRGIVELKRHGWATHLEGLSPQLRDELPDSLLPLIRKGPAVS